MRGVRSGFRWELRALEFFCLGWQIPGLRRGWDTWAATCPQWTAVGTKKNRTNASLVPRFSLLPVSLSRSVGTGRREPWEKGWANASSSINTDAVFLVRTVEPLSREEKFDLLQLWCLSKIKSNTVTALTWRASKVLPKKQRTLSQDYVLLIFNNYSTILSEPAIVLVYIHTKWPLQNKKESH